MTSGKLVAINEFQIKVRAKVVLLLPYRMALKMIEKMQTKSCSGAQPPQP